MNNFVFPARTTSTEIELGTTLQPKFGADGLIPCITQDAITGEVLMFAFMNAEALALTIGTGVAHFWSRSRAALWKKGAESGNVFNVVEMRTDCDQDVLWVRVAVDGDAHACHTGRRSCFYRLVPVPGVAGTATHLVLAPDADDGH